MGGACRSEDASFAREASGHEVLGHFPDGRKMVQIGSQAAREVEDLMISIDCMPARWIVGDVNNCLCHIFQKCDIG